MKDLDKTLERTKKSTIEESFGDYGTKRLFQENDFAHYEEREG
ncbi:hypothetical protein [Candidatus Mesenet endosymbiont of Agriotes lineatus]